MHFLRTRTRVPQLLAFALFVGAPSAQAQLPDAIAPGTGRYHLIEQTVVSNSMSVGGAMEIRRDLYFVMALAASKSGLNVALTLDSVVVTSAQRGRTTLPAFANAGWRGTMSLRGAGPIGQFVLADGSPTSSPLVTPLRWALPVLPASTDVLEITTVAQSGAKRVLRAERSFVGDGGAVALSGRVRITANGELKMDEAVVDKQGFGTLEGNWRIGRDGTITGANLTYEMSDSIKMGGEDMKTTERTTLTLTRLP